MYRYVIVVMIVIGIVCGIVSEKSKSQHVVINDYAACTNLKQMYDRASFIVEGYFMQATGIWNMARNDFDNSKENKEFYTEGILYLFNVENVFKGSVPDTITITQRHSDNYSGKTKIDENYFEVDCSKRYIVFLYYNEEFDHYYAGFVPWAIRVENESVYLEGINEASLIEDTITGNSYQEILDIICQ